MGLRKFFCALCAAALLLSALPAALAEENPTFTDMADIQHLEAATVLGKLGVMGGKGDGAFHPTGSLTRAECAKIMMLLMSGGMDVDTGVKAVPTFSDIRGHWAECYIEHCVDLGIVSGRGDGTFDPDGEVTGIALIKMTLAALGHDPDTYGLTGPNWAEKADQLARYTGPSLYAGLSAVSLGQPISRDDTAQILYNALQATPLVVTPDGVGENGKILWKFKSATRKDGALSTLLYERFRLELAEVMPSSAPAAEDQI